MDRSKKIVKSFLISAEGYFHCRRVLKDGKNLRHLEQLLMPNYKKIRDISKNDIMEILLASLVGIDKDLFNKIPSTAIHASLGSTVWSYKKGLFQSKIDSNVYNILYKILEIKTGKEGNYYE